MKWKVRKPGARDRAKHFWHKWFAWKPVRVPTHGKKSNMTMVWLSLVKRKGHYISGLNDYLHNYGEGHWVWEYDFIKKEK